MSALHRRSRAITLDEIVDTWLPARVGALDDMLWVLELSDKYGDEVAINLHIEDGPGYRSNLRLLTEPMVAAGYLHARALLEFMGISAKNGELVQIRHRRSGDLAIEHYFVNGAGLSMVTLDEVYAAINMPRAVVEWALVTTIERANKIFAHITTAEVLAMALDSQVRVALRGISMLVHNYLFAKLGRAELIPIKCESTYSCNTCNDGERLDGD